MRKAYTVYIIPVANREAINVAYALVNGDDPLNSNAFSVPANTTGNWDDPHTHYYGGMPSTEAWETQVSNLATAMPGDAWPYGDVTKAEAQTAATVMHLTITVTQDGSEPSPQETLANALAAQGLKKCEQPL
jgi:hypothetical protein